MNTALIYLALYLLGIIYITYKSAKGETDGDYINSSKNLSANESTWTTFASLLSGYNFVLGVTFSFIYGMWYLMAFVGSGFAFLTLYYFYKKKLVPLQTEHNLLSLGDYFGAQNSGSTKNIINSILCLCLLLFMTLQIFVNTNLFSSLLHVSNTIALLVTTGVVCVYLYFGGFKASVKTDIFQGVLMLPIVLVIFFLPNHISSANIISAFDPSQFWFAIGLAITQFLSLLGQAENFQRVFASRDVASLRKGLIRAFMLLVVVAGCIAYLGINFKLSGVVTDPSNLFIGNVLTSLPSWLQALLSVSLIAAFMGTIDSSAFAFGTLASSFKKIDPNNIVRLSRRYILVGIISSSLVSIYLFSFLASVFALISLVSLVGTTLLVSALLKPSTFEINTFLLTGIVTFILGLIFKFITDNPLTTLIPAGVGITALLLIRAFTKNFQH